MKKSIQEIRGDDNAELKAKLNDLRKEQFQLRFRSSTEAVAKPSRASEIRKTIARIMTVMGDRARNEGKKQ